MTTQNEHRLTASVQLVWKYRPEVGFQLSMLKLRNVLVVHFGSLVLDLSGATHLALCLSCKKSRRSDYLDQHCIEPDGGRQSLHREVYPRAHLNGFLN